MQISLMISPTGEHVTVETVSLLEDLWHDYQFFKAQAAQLETASGRPDSAFIVKRYRRVALLALVFYFEGVANNWLKHLVEASDWTAKERMPLAGKLKIIEEKLGLKLGEERIKGATKLRNDLAHLKPGNDLALFEAVSEDLLAKSEAVITEWLSAAEEKIGVVRHPNSREASRRRMEWVPGVS